jgi:DNA mismatch repair ATPase MutS
MYILTGANNGGKTTFARAVGVCQILAQAGLYVPAQECSISLCDYVFTHFPKEEQLGIDASKFTSEIKDFKTISEKITENSILLMNESIQSTTPNECVGVAKELLNVFCIIGVRGIFVTHLIDIADYMDSINANEYNKSKISSLVMTVDESTGQRLYKISKELPDRTSHSVNILSKYGISVDEIIRRNRTR